MKKFYPAETILSAKAATGVDSTAGFDVSNFDTIVLEVSTASSANMTLKVQGSVATSVPTWTSAAAVANAWDYVGFYNYNSGSFVDGDTGLVYSGTDAVEILTVNVDHLKWLNVNITARSAGAATVRMIGVKNE